MNNLFNSSKKWFRFSEYQIIKKDKVSYIQPTSESEIEWYEPFKNFPDILISFLNTREAMEKVNHFRHDLVATGKNVNEEYSQLYIQQAEFFKDKFVNKYGLPGLFWNDVTFFHETKENKLVFYNKVGSIFNCISRECNNSEYDNTPGIIEYSNYAREFFPHLNQPYPYPFGEDKNDFFQNYSEPINYILMDKMLYRIYDHQSKLNEYKKGILPDKKESKINEFLAKGNYQLKIELKDSVINDYGDTKKERWDLSRKFTNLRDGLSLMYALNLTNKIGKQTIKKCEWCGEYFKVGPGARSSKSKYCDTCKTSARKKINRGVRAILRGEKTIQEIANKHKEYNKDIKEVKSWIEDYNPNSDEMQQLLKEYKKKADWLN